MASQESREASYRNEADADATVFVRFTHTYLDCMKAVEEFLMDDFIFSSRPVNPIN